MQETLNDLKELELTPQNSKASSAVRKKGRKISAKCWMAQKFPMSLRQLLPVMDVIGHANKHLGRMAKFLRKYGDMELFPVKLQVKQVAVLLYILVGPPTCQPHSIAVPFAAMVLSNSNSGIAVHI